MYNVASRYKFMKTMSMLGVAECLLSGPPLEAKKFVYSTAIAHIDKHPFTSTIEEFIVFGDL